MLIIDFFCHCCDGGGVGSGCGGGCGSISFSGGGCGSSGGSLILDFCI